MRSARITRLPETKMKPSLYNVAQDVVINQALRTIRKRKYQINKDTTRPYRLYNAKANMFIRWRYYSSQRHAEWGVLKEMKWLAVGTVIEVVDVSRGKLLCVYEHVVEGGKHGIRYTDY